MINDYQEQEAMQRTHEEAPQRTSLFLFPMVGCSQAFSRQTVNRMLLALLLKKDEMDQNNCSSLIARIRMHCQQVIQGARPRLDWRWKGEGWVGEYIDEHNSFVTLKTAVPGQELSFAFPPATEQQLRKTEQQLGFSLPPLLRLLYTQIANGGFGPGYGITGAVEGYPFDGVHLHA